MFELGPFDFYNHQKEIVDLAVEKIRLNLKYDYFCYENSPSSNSLKFTVRVICDNPDLLNLLRTLPEQIE